LTDNQENKAQRAIKAILESKVCPAQKEIKDFKGCRVSPVKLVLKASQGSKARKVTKAFRESKARPVLKEIKGFKACRA
jgi:hypothetical protein